MKSFNTNLKWSACNAVIAAAHVYHNITTLWYVEHVNSANWVTSLSLTNTVVTDTDTLEKFDLVVAYAVLQKVFHIFSDRVKNCCYQYLLMVYGLLSTSLCLYGNHCISMVIILKNVFTIKLEHLWCLLHLKLVYEVLPSNTFTDDVSRLEKVWILLTKYMNKGSGHKLVSFLKISLIRSCFRYILTKTNCQVIS